MEVMWVRVSVYGCYMENIWVTHIHPYKMFSIYSMYCHILPYIAIYVLFVYAGLAHMHECFHRSIYEAARVACMYCTFMIYLNYQ